jgi:hypothetical protein
MPEIVSSIVCEAGRYRNKLARVILTDGRELFFEFGAKTANWRIHYLLIPMLVRDETGGKRKKKHESPKGE